MKTAPLNRFVTCFAVLLMLLLVSCDKGRLLKKGEGTWHIDKIYEDTCESGSIFGIPGCAVTGHSEFLDVGTITFEKHGVVTMTDSTGTQTGTWESDK